jgi:hypothetical protein
VTVKPGQQAGAGSRESHYCAPEAQPPAGVQKDPNDYVPYLPDLEIVEAILSKNRHLRPGMLSRLRRELGRLGVDDLKDRAELANVSPDLVRRWWARSGLQRRSAVGE